VVWGCGNLTGTDGGSPAIVLGTVSTIQSNDFTWDSQKTELRNEAGDVVGMASYNGKKSISINMMPSHATAIATAKENINKLMFAPGTAITITDADGAVIDGTFSGAYQLETSRVNRTNNGPVTVDLTLVQFVDNDITLATT